MMVGITHKESPDAAETWWYIWKVNQDSVLKFNVHSFWPTAYSWRMQCVVVEMAHGLDQHQAAEDGQPVSKMAMNPLYWVFHIWVDDATGIHVLALLVAGISTYITRLFMPIIFETLGTVFTTSLSLSVSFWPSPPRRWANQAEENAKAGIWVPRCTFS